jgi:hypothetical protein
VGVDVDAVRHYAGLVAHEDERLARLAGAAPTLDRFTEPLYQRVG